MPRIQNSWACLWPECWVIETDGAIEQADTLKVATTAPVTGMHLRRDPLDALFLSAARDRGPPDREAALSAQRRAYRIHQVCGGGLYAHRYRIRELFGLLPGPDDAWPVIDLAVAAESLRPAR
jgi:hypothetical protein